MRRMLLLIMCVCYMGILIARSLTALPNADESNYSLPAWNLANHGSFGMPVAEPIHNTVMPGWTKPVVGFDKNCYMFMPLPLIAQAAWFRLLPYSVLTLRLFSAMWAIVALLACFYLVRKLTGSDAVALLAA